MRKSRCLAIATANLAAEGSLRFPGGKRILRLLIETAQSISHHLGNTERPKDCNSHCPPPTVGGWLLSGTVWN